MPTFTKDIGRHDKITIDGTDVSNAFREFRYNSEHANEDATGFSVSGNRESLAGATDQSFTGTAFDAEELNAIVEPIHRSRDIVEITYQPNGLTDSTREVYYGNCQILVYETGGEVGAVRTKSFTAVPADSTGILTNNWT